MVVELTICSLIGWADTMKTELSRTGFARVNKAANVFTQRSETKTVTRANDCLIDPTGFCLNLEWASFDLTTRPKYI